MGSVILGTAVGLVLMFGLIALLCSALLESVSNALQMRARYLLRGLRTMLDQSVTSQGAAAGPGAARGGDSSALRRGGDLRVLHDAALAPADVTAAAEVVNTLAVAANAEPAPTGATPASVTPASALPASVTPASAVPASAAAGGATAGGAGAAEAPGSGGPVAAARDALMHQTGGLTVALFAHPLVRSLQTRRVSLWRDGKRNPPYMSASLFTQALLDTLVPDDAGETNLAQVEKTLRLLPDGLPAKRSLLALARRAAGDLDAFERLVGEWYDEHMLRVSGWYKRWSKVMLGILGLLVAVVLNIDTLQVAHSLYADQPLRSAVLAQVSDGRLCADAGDVAAHAACAQREIAKLDVASLPIGWPLSDVQGWQWPAKILGWLLTALAVSFGAPFWFDALTRVSTLRGGVPKQK